MILFLDFDGVFRRTGSPLYRLEADLVERFDCVCAEHPDIRIVITSTWREAMTLNELRQSFPASLRLRIVGVTPLSRHHGDHGRYREVLAFLKRLGPPAKPWVALDDDSLHYPPSVNVILTDPAKGFDDEAAEPLRGSLV